MALAFRLDEQRANPLGQDGSATRRRPTKESPAGASTSSNVPRSGGAYHGLFGRQPPPNAVAGEWRTRLRQEGWPSLDEVRSGLPSALSELARRRIALGGGGTKVDHTISEDELREALGIPEDCPPLPKTVDGVRTSDLAGVCKIDLGRCEIFGCEANCHDSSGAPSRYPDFVRFTAELPPGYVPFAPAGTPTMFEEFLPEWSRAISGGTLQEDAEAIVEEAAGGFEAHGMFFGDNGFTDVLRLAVRTIGAFAYVLDTVPAAFRDAGEYDSSTMLDAISARSFRVKVRDSAGMELVRSSVRVSDTGEVTVYRTAVGPGAWTFDPASYFLPPTGAIISMSPKFAVDAAVADYYFWWANLLQCKVAEGLGDAWDYWVGLLCARCGLAQVLEIARLLVHEIGHMYPGSPYHCQDLLFDNQYCATFHASFCFRAFVQAELALPLAHLESSLDEDYAADRFDVGGESASESEGAAIDDEQWVQKHKLDFDPYSFLGLFEYDEACNGGEFEAKHCGMFSYSHRVEVSWSVPTSCCDEEGDASGTVVFNSSASDDC